jgi:uncharacterized protein YutE (UPF0331/DUF86 family)
MKILEPKMDALARCLLRIESKKPFTVEQLKSDFDLQDIVSINLERAVQQSVDIASVILAETNEPAPLTMADSFAKLGTQGWLSSATVLRMQKAVGMRNLMVHEYEKLDWSIVYAICTHHLDDFKKFAKEILVKAGSSN